MKKYAEWLASRGQIWPVRRAVTRLAIGPVTLFHNLPRPQPAEEELMARIAKACDGQAIRIAFGHAAAEVASREPPPSPGGMVLAPEVQELAKDPAAKKALWQEIQRRLAGGRAP